MNDQNATDAILLRQTIRPAGFAHRYSPSGLLHGLCDVREEAERDVSRVGGSAHVVTLYDEAAIVEAVAAERKRILKRGEEFAANVLLSDGDKAFALHGFLIAIEAGA